MLLTSIFLQHDSEGHWEHFLESINMLIWVPNAIMWIMEYSETIKSEPLTSRSSWYSWENRTQTEVFRILLMASHKNWTQPHLGKRGMSWKTGEAKGRAEVRTAGCKAHLSPGLCPAPSRFRYSLCIGLSLRLASFRRWPPSLLATWSTSCDCIM